MKYLCLGYFNPNEMDARPPAEIEELMGRCPPHMDAVYQTGRVLLDAGLVNQSKVLRRVKGKLRVTDGPYTETKEMLGSVVILEASDLDEAVRIASLHPTTQLAEGEALGWRMEVRPIHYFHKP